jgi:protein TonB
MTSLDGKLGSNPGVERPRILREVKPVYTDGGLKAKIQGSVVLDCVVEADGRMGACIVVHSLDTLHGLDAEALRVVRQWTFSPATKDGVPVAIVVTLILEFNLY